MNRAQAVDLEEARRTFVCDCVVGKREVCVEAVWAWAWVERTLVQILVLVAITGVENARAEETNGFTWIVKRSEWLGHKGEKKFVVTGSRQTTPTPEMESG